MKINCNLEGATLRTGKSSLPSGTYNLQITNCDVVQTSKGDSAIKLEYAVADGELQGRPWSEFFNVHHGTPQVAKIAKDDLFTLLTHAGHKKPRMLSDSSEVIGLKVRMVLEEEHGEWTKDDGEVVKTTNNRVIMRLPYEEGIGSVSEAPTEQSKQETAATPAIDEEVPW